METQFLEHMKKKEHSQSIEILNKLLQNKNNSKKQTVSYLKYRSECMFELANYESVIIDCRNILKHADNECHQTRIRLLKSLFFLNRHAEAEEFVIKWLCYSRQHQPQHKDLHMFLERYFTIDTKQKLDFWLEHLQLQFFNVHTIMSSSQIICIYCNLTFNDKSELRVHCQSEEHEMMIMSDDGHDWHWRAPPRGFKSDCYAICENWKELGTCRFGIQCVEAHGIEELTEWKERFQYREMKLLRAKEKELYGKSYTEELLEKWIQTINPCLVMKDKISDVEDYCLCPLSATVSSKNSIYEWQFILKSIRPLKAVALLQDTHRNHFNLTKIQIANTDCEIRNQQEWLSTNLITDFKTTIEYIVNVQFQTTIFGTFRQTVVFDFNSYPVLIKHLCVDVIPDSDLEKINDIRKEIQLSISERWTNSNSDIVMYHSNYFNQNNLDWEKNLRKMYPCPEIGSFVLSNATVSEKKFTKNNYRERMHELLYVEEMERYNLIAQYNLTTKLQIAHSYILSPNSMAASTAKYSNSGELYASIHLGKELSEDTSEGRLILMHCNSVYLNPLPESQPRKIYEALIEDKGKNMIYLRLSAQFVNDFNLTPDNYLDVQIQFQLNRIPYCEWHYTIDKMPNFKIIFPDTYLEPSIPWSPSRQWSVSLDSRLNLKQKEAIVAITTPNYIKLPPILVIGPFGTGKTFTLAQAIKEIIKDENNRILLCTHSNSAADLYIKDYLDVWVDNGNENARPLRIYYQNRWVATVSPIVQKYCLIKTNGTMRSFQVPTLEDIEKHKIIVVTLSTSVYLSAIGLSSGYFTHILLDEAAQAIECETITPLALANESTRIVLAGDHMQLGPDIFSKFVKDRNLHISLLERLYDHYPALFPCKILLCENYRAHEAIIQFTSESFYDQKLISSSKQPKHTKFYPLTFFTTRGEDVQDKNSTAFYNNSEVYEVVERVLELKRNWPNDWGEINEQSISVVTPYSDQVFRIRSELRKRRIDNVCVERVLNVQGKQFRAVVLSTVRTRRTCSNTKSSNDVDYGFLSNSKLLNTAITRAQSLVAVVGDPIALCSLGRCSKVWGRFIQICKDNDSLFGITWTQLKFQLDGIELKKIYTLNPLAPEFIPRKYREMKIQPAPIINPPIPIPPINTFPTVRNDIRFLPIIYPQTPIIPTRPVFMPNGYRQQIRVPNPPILIPVPPPPQIRKIPISIISPPILQSIKPQNKLIQFMNNVHFPEAQMLSDCVNLLPQSMSLADMIVQPPNIQERWYNYLKGTVGFEAAEKFKYLLHTTNQKGSRITEPNIFDRTTPSSSDSPTFNWYDSPSNQINFNKPIYMREVEGNINDLPKSNPLYERHTRQETDKLVNGNAMNGCKKEDDLQRHINEGFAKLSINSSTDDLLDIFQAFSNDFSSNRSSDSNESYNINEARFYKYFS